MLQKNGQVLCEESGSGLTVHVRGEIDHHSAVSVRRVIDERITLCRPKEVYLELSGVDFMDSSGLGLIMGRYALVKQSGGELYVLDPSAAVVKMMKLAGMERMIRLLKHKEIFAKEGKR